MEVRGTLKSWNDDKGFGFIRPEAGGAEVFAHISVVRGDRRPQAGDRVLYVLATDERGRARAAHLRLESGLALDRPVIRRKPRPPAAAAGRPARQSNAGIRQWPLKLVVLALLLALPLWGSLQWSAQGRPWGLLGYALGSVLALLFYWADKRSAQRGAWRTPENTLQMIALLGGWPGALLAQQWLRHKTRKPGFQLVFWSIVALHQLFWLDQLWLGGRYLALLGVY